MQQTFFTPTPLFSIRGSFGPQGTFAKVWKHFFVVTTEGGVAPGIWWVGASDADKHPTMSLMEPPMGPPATTDCPTPNALCVKAENSVLLHLYVPGLNNVLPRNSNYWRLSFSVVLYSVLFKLFMNEYIVLRTVRFKKILELIQLLKVCYFSFRKVDYKSL